MSDQDGSTRSRAAAALLPRFLGHRVRDLETVREALEHRDFEPISRIGHNMRGNGVSYGFPEISDIGQRLEAAAKARSAGHVQDQLGRLEACLARIGADAATAASPPSPRLSSSTRVRAEGPDAGRTERQGKRER